ncbi:MAG: hypothetical protein L3J00_06210 [Thiomicrorhabdus sp.]|nr:hypothetical protein [Thiomicrorhabdus sp.]
MVAGKNKLFALALVLSFSIAFAEEQTEKDKYKLQVISIVQKEVEIATSELEDAIDKCREEKRVSNLSVSDFKNIDFSGQEMSTFLVYHSLKADTKCITEAKLKNLPYYLIKLRSVLKYYNDPRFQEIDVDDFSILTHPSSAFEEELKIKYNEIEPKKRAVLEQTPELSKPFQPFKFLREIESETYNIQKAL